MTITDTLGKTTVDVALVPKGWGYEKIFVNNEDYCGKLLHFVAGYRCSVHYHRKKHETFYLHKGSMEVYYHEDADALEALLKKTKTHPEAKVYDFMEKFVLTQGMTFEVPVGRVHQMVALTDSELFEFSTQDSPEDSYRIIKGN